MNLFNVISLPNDPAIISEMEGQNDGNGWVFGLSFICLGIVCVIGMGVFSMVYHRGLRRKF